LIGHVTAAPDPALREQIFFDEWNSGGERLSLSTICCITCGFCCFSPRPSTRQLDRKYELFNQKRRGTKRKTPSKPKPTQLTRQQLLRERLAPHLRAHHLRYLDFGGGDGFLISQFASQENRCFVIDYQDPTNPDVIKLGNSIDDIPAGSTYDVVVCSHVLEHVVEPRQILTRLHRSLAPEGLIYVEVPLEIFGAIRIDNDPVTHVNFFTPASLRTLVRKAGFSVLECSIASAPYAHELIDVVWLLAKPDQIDSTSARDPVETPDVRRYLHPGRIALLRRLLKGMARRLRAKH
jgi:SAM-dependent methyltransferase